MSWDEFDEEDAIDWLAAPTELRPLERVIFPDDVGGEIAWQVLVNDGALVPLYAEAALPFGVSPTVELRAQAVQAVIPEAIRTAEAQYDDSRSDIKAALKPMAIANRAAAWIWLGGEPPTEVDMISDTGRSRIEPGQVKARVRQAPFSHAHVQNLAGVWVTNPTRTIRDLAVWCTRAEAVPLIRQLVDLGGNLRQATMLLERPLRLLNRPAARETLKAVAGLG